MGCGYFDYIENMLIMTDDGRPEQDLNFSGYSCPKP